MLRDKAEKLFQRLKNPVDLFGGINMTWLRVCVFAVAIGIYVGIINQIPFLYDTSFRDIAITHEWWVLFAVLIVSNSKGPLDAGLKCFVFFLISQPVIYIIELPTIGLQAALSYWLKIWLPITILTLPGGAVAYFSKKQNALGAVILGIGNAIVGILCVHYVTAVCSAFPRHLLTVVFCVAIIALLLFSIQRKMSTRLLSAGTTALLVAGAVIVAKIANLSI